MNDYKPELGQMIFGCPYATYEPGPLGEAALRYVLHEIKRVYGNREQMDWDEHTDPGIPGIVFRPYYWGDDETQQTLPNFESAEVEIRWYKNPWRGVSVAKDMQPTDWDAWLRETLRCVYAWGPH